MKRIFAFLMILLVLAYAGFSQTNLKEIIKIQSRIASQLTNPVEGFGRKISGEDIVYHSTRQDCQKALLVRATNGNMSISWETPAVTPAVQNGDVELFLIAGMSMAGYEMNGVDPGFQVFINDQPYFHFRNSMGENWTASGPEGSRMVFQTVFKDQAQDGFGYARLVLPPKLFSAGKPLQIRIVGDESGSRHWFMVFQCSDGLDWFVNKSGIDSWFDIHFTQMEGKWNGIMNATEAWTGQTVVITGNTGKPAKVHLKKNENLATGSFTLDSSVSAISIDYPGNNPLSNIGIMSTVSKSIVEPDRLVSYQIRPAGQATFLIQVHVASSSIAGNLRKIADSDIARGLITIMASSHQDIAWMDSPQACVEDRDNLLITPALKKLEENPLYYNDMEDILMLREYLARHPGKKELIHNLTREGRLTWGASYMQPYEEMYFGEPLIRQFYLGRKWFKDEFPGCDARIYWNVDVPGRTLQMPQILAKSGVNYMIISRHDRGMFNWLSPDGSKVLTYSPGHYYNDYINLKKGFFETVQHISDLNDFWGKYYTRNSVNPVIPVLSDADMAVPDSYFDYIEMWNSLKNPSLQLPDLVHSTAERFMDAAAAHRSAFPTLQGERPAVWLYIHGPSHYEALKAGRNAGLLLPAAEKMASLRSKVLDNWTLYPQDRLVKAWESAIYPDHGWGGKNGDVTDQTFLDKFREAEQVARKIIEESTQDIAGHISLVGTGIPLVVFNSLTWVRTDPVEVRLNLPDKSFKAITIMDHKGKNVNFQLTGPLEYYPSGYIKTAEVVFIPENIPSLGYQTFYVGAARKMPNWETAIRDCPEVVETGNYRMHFGKGGMNSLFDKDLQKEIWRTDQFKAGDLFSMRSIGNGAGEFADIQQPDMEGFEMPGIGPVWSLTEDGPVRKVIQGSVEMKHNKATVTWIVYPSLKRIDIKVDLIDWDGTAYREFRLAFPAGLQNPEISYEVPFGVVRVGKDELAQAAGERYTTHCKDVHPRGINNWISANDSDIGLTISSSVAVWDYVNMTNRVTHATLLQPILLASRQSCHGEGPLYHQTGSHSMEFSLFTHEPGWKNGYRYALQANEKLTTVFNPVIGTRLLPENLSFLSVDDPHALVSTIKKAEDDSDLIVRIYDQEGRDRTVKVSLYANPVFIEQTNLIEQDRRAISPDGKGITVKLGHHAIETFKIRF